MTRQTGITLIDVIVLVAVVLAFAAALRRGAGVLAGVGAVLGTLVVAWLATVALAAWGPGVTERAARDSALLEVVPLPQRAVDQTGRLVGDLLGGPGRP